MEVSTSLHTAIHACPPGVPTLPHNCPFQCTQVHAPRDTDVQACALAWPHKLQAWIFAHAPRPKGCPSTTRAPTLVQHGTVDVAALMHTPASCFCEKGSSTAHSLLHNPVFPPPSQGAPRQQPTRCQEYPGPHTPCQAHPAKHTQAAAHTLPSTPCQAHAAKRTLAHTHPGPPRQQPTHYQACAYLVPKPGQALGSRAPLDAPCPCSTRHEQKASQGNCPLPLLQVAAALT